MDRASVAGSGVAVGVLGGDGDAEGPPVVAEAGAVTTRVLAAAGLTATVALPVIEEVTVSVAVTVWLPAVFRVRPVKVCTPASAAVKV